VTGSTTDPQAALDAAATPLVPGTVASADSPSSAPEPTSATGPVPVAGPGPSVPAGAGDPEVPAPGTPATAVPAQAPAAAPPTAGRQGHYAGGVTRLVAFAADIGASWGIFTVSLAAITFAIQLVTSQTVDLGKSTIGAAIVVLSFLVWEFVYFTYQWSLSGKTIGMAVLGIRVVATDGTPVSARQAAIRTITLPLSFLFFGLGFLGILLNKDRHAWHDRLAKTVVVYSWDARAARLRWLAKQDPVPPT
jgi:uncharacterized RDD family membrane protein YckC